MLKNWLNKFFKSEDQEAEFFTPNDQRAHFILKYKNLIIGSLTHEDGNWKFEYSDEFKRQNEIDILVDFPEKEKRYVDKNLWPFFAHRIPGLGQPKVQEIIKLENLNPRNEI